MSQNEFFRKYSDMVAEAESKKLSEPIVIKPNEKPSDPSPQPKSDITKPDTKPETDQETGPNAPKPEKPVEEATIESTSQLLRRYQDVVNETEFKGITNKLDSARDLLTKYSDK